MKSKLLMILLATRLLLGASSFTTADPPMMYIYHFVAYDSSTTIMHNDYPNITDTQGLDDSNNSIDKTASLEMVEPKIISAMVTSAVAKYKQMKIAGESIQSRIANEDVMQMVKSYAYPKETDYIMLGEINVIGAGMRRDGKPLEPLFGGGIQYEIDLKVIDVSSQDIISAKSISVKISDLNSIRESINTVIDDLMVDILSPFLSNIILYADTTSAGKILWNTLVIRPVQTMVSGKTAQTTDKDLEMAVTTSFQEMNAMMPELLLADSVQSDEYMLISTSFDRKLRSWFLQGEYYFKVYLKDYAEAEYYEETITVEALRGKAFSVKLLPPPPPPAYGDLQISNIQNNIGFEVYQMDGAGELTRIVRGYNKNNSIQHSISTFAKGNISNKNQSVFYEDLPLGTYVVTGYGRAEESFPGKHFVKLYESVADTVIISRGGEKVTSIMTDVENRSGRDVVIYFDPFPMSENEEYRLYMDDSKNPFTIVSVVGELHIEGIPTDFSGTMTAMRDGFSPAVIPIVEGNEKAYLLASMTIPAKSDQKKEKMTIGSFLK